MKKRTYTMSLDISPEIEARILARAKEAGLSIDDYLEQVVNENEQFDAIINKIEAKTKPLSPEQVKAKIDRGLAQLERGEYVDGERFMKELLSDIEDA
jgi:predicted transcriptional regulator